MSELDYTKIGEHIRLIRNKQNLSQEDLAEICDISPSYMGHIERGTRKMSLETFVTIANALHVSCDYLLYNQADVDDNVIKTIIESVKYGSPNQYQKYITIIKALSEITEHL